MLGKKVTNDHVSDPLQKVGKNWSVEAILGFVCYADLNSPPV